eukprot:292574-Hanusia_phi.AAC.10
MNCATGGHKTVTAYLLENGASANVANKFAETVRYQHTALLVDTPRQPMHFAVQRGDMGMVEMLHEHGDRILRIAGQR